MEIGKKLVELDYLTEVFGTTVKFANIVSEVAIQKGEYRH